VRAFGATDKGRVRATNEDFFVIDEPLGLTVVADGMGGHNAGEVASRVAVEAITEYVREFHARRGGISSSPNIEETWPFGVDPNLSEGGNVLRTAIHLANMQILEMASTSEEFTGMGTTVVAVLAAGAKMAIAHVGDSRAYLLSSGRMRQLTDDDSWVASVLALNPQTDPAVLRHHPMRNALTNVVGARPGVDVHVVEEKLSAGDQLLLTTDGVHGVLDGDQLLRFLEAHESGISNLPDALVGAALERGSRDNCTAVVLTL
jgi:protein phosphatase